MYCRGADLLLFLTDNKELINRKHADALDNPIETKADAEALCAKLIQYGFLYKAEYRPLDGAIEVGENGRFRRPKWPKRLEMSAKQNFEENQFYCCVYEGSKRWQHFMLFCVVAAVLCICMFPAWPLKLKIGVWYIAVILLTLLLSLVLLRLILFLLLWFVGFECWLFPNLFNEDAGFIDSFMPLFACDKLENTPTLIAVRAFSALLTAATIYHLGETHSAADVAAFAGQSFVDILDWGRMRLEAPYLDSGKALPSAAEPQEEDNSTESTSLSDEEDYRCLSACGYKSFEDLMASKCLVKCSCMQDIVNSSCFSTCADSTRAAVEEAAADACREEEARRKKKQQRV